MALAYVFVMSVWVFCISAKYEVMVLLWKSLAIYIKELDDVQQWTPHYFNAWIMMPMLNAVYKKLIKGNTTYICITSECVKMSIYYELKVE